MALGIYEEEDIRAIANKLRAYGDPVQYTVKQMADGIETVQVYSYNAGHREGIAEGIKEGKSIGYAEGKTDGIEEGRTEGIEEGKLALLRESKYMNATKSGTVVTADAVNPLEHYVSVQLSSDSVTDFSAVNVKQYGKNLINPSEIMYGKELSSGQIVDSPNWYVTSLIPVKPNTTYALSGVSSTYRVEYDVKGLFLKANTLGVFTTGSDTRYVRFNSLIDGYDNPQLELGTIATEYEPYIEPTTYTATADGRVTDVKNRSQSMTFVSDTDNVTINVAYLRDIDTYIDNLIMNVALTGGE